MIYAVTGPVQLSLPAQEFVKATLNYLPTDSIIVSGCAFGVDTVAAIHAIDTGRFLWLVVPKAPHNSWLEENLPYQRLIQVPKVGTISQNYMARNDELVRLITPPSTGALLGFPATEERQRSGTWSTIRRARKANRPVHLHRLDRLP